MVFCQKTFRILHLVPFKNLYICFCYISLHLPKIGQNLISARHFRVKKGQNIDLFGAVQGPLRPPKWSFWTKLGTFEGPRVPQRSLTWYGCDPSSWTNPWRTNRWQLGPNQAPLCLRRTSNLFATVCSTLHITWSVNFGAKSDFLLRINATHPHLNMAPKAPNLTEHFSIENMVTHENVLISPILRHSAGPNLT